MRVFFSSFLRLPNAEPRGAHLPPPKKKISPPPLPQAPSSLSVPLMAKHTFNPHHPSQSPHASTEGYLVCMKLLFPEEVI